MVTCEHRPQFPICLRGIAACLHVTTPVHDDVAEQVGVALLVRGQHCPVHFEVPSRLKPALALREFSEALATTLARAEDCPCSRWHWAHPRRQTGRASCARVRGGAVRRARSRAKHPLELSSTCSGRVPSAAAKTSGVSAAAAIRRSVIPRARRGESCSSRRAPLDPTVELSVRRRRSSDPPGEIRQHEPRMRIMRPTCGNGTRPAAEGTSWPVSRVLYPGRSPGDGHPSRTSVAAGLVRSTRRHRTGSPPAQEPREAPS